MEREIEKESIEKVDKNKVKKYRIVIIILSSIIGFFAILTIAISIVLSNEKKYSSYPDKITILSTQSKDKYDEKMKEKYGIVFYIKFNYSMHPKYDEWKNKYGSKEDWIDSGNTIESYWEKMSQEFYETINSDFEDLEYTIKNLSIQFFYSINSDENLSLEESKKKMNEIKNDFFTSLYYKKCFNLSSEEFIENIIIEYYLPACMDK